MSNPFEPPDGALDTPESSDLVPLYSSAAVAGTTFFGSPILGSVLVISNAWRIKHSLPAALMWCGAFNLVYFLAAFILPEATPGVVFALAGLYGMRQLNTTLFENDLAALDTEGGPWAPWWHGALLFLLIVVPFGALIVVVLIAEGSL